jgi:transporter family protein
VPGAPSPPPTLVPPKAGLFGFAGQATGTQLPPLRISLLLLFCVLAFGAAQVINGAASRLVPPRFVVPPGTSAVAPLALVTRVFDPGAAIALFRMASILCIAGAQAVLGDVPPSPWQLPSTPRQLLTPVLIGVTNVGGFLPFMLLTSVSGVALWSGLLALYVLGPILYGILARGESRAPRKLAGVACAVLAAVLLALPSGGGGESVAADGPGGDGGLPGWARLVLYLLTAALWAVADTSIAYVGRDTHLLHVTALSSVGFGFVALACSAASFALTASAGGGQLAGGGGGGGGYAILFLGQALGTLGWFSMAKLGKSSEASAFLPVVCLYAVAAAVFAVGFMGERLSAAGWVGVLLGGGGMVLIASSTN